MHAVSFYRFVVIEDAAELREQLYELCRQFELKGTILLASEGINAMLAGVKPKLAGFMEELQKDSRFAELDAKYSDIAEYPFQRLKIKVKKEIITFGEPDANPNLRVGEYVEPESWNALIQTPGVKLVDTRNSYEVFAGTFRGAIDPQTRNFTQFKKYVDEELDPSKDKEVAMFCTGGIRCEKATAYLLNKGFEKVYHLRGGILRYLERVPKEESLFEGDCFVFDERRGVDHDLLPSIEPIDVSASPEY